jgi:outer membrane lipoprotein-sorting protein
MKQVIRIFFFTLAVAVLGAARASSQTDVSVLTADDVVAKMMMVDAERRSEMTGYTATRRYSAVNRDRRAEMVVRVDCSSDGAKLFTILSEEGSKSIRKQVFRKMLSEESEASGRESRDGSRIIPSNYKFSMVGQETLATGLAYVLAIIPRTDNKHLIDGRIWVDAKDFSIVRIEGQPARNPSFWVHDVHFVHIYRRVGRFWFAASTHSTSEVRIFGPSELTIDNSDYVLNPLNNHTADAESIARLVP